MRSWILIAMSITTLGEEVWAQSNAGAPTWRPVVMGKNGMVAAEHPLQAVAGLRVLQNGGNAIDAAVAVFYMTAVTEPSEAGLGGDGFLMAYIKKLDRVVLVNGSGGAPKLATREYYQTKVGSVPPDGPYSTMVPGAVGGFDLLHQEYGTKDYRFLLADAVEAASKGYAVSAWGAGNFVRSRAMLSRWDGSVKAFFSGGRPPGVGDWLVQPDLARTISMIAEQGASAFYRGEIARMTARYHERNGGLIRYEDMASFQAEEAEPIRISYRGYEVYQSPPNSGGIVMLMALNILEGFDLKKLGHNTPEYLHVLMEAFKLAFADRYPYITDPRFAPQAPIAQLLSKEYAKLRRGLIKMDRAIEGVAPPGDPAYGKAILAGHEIRYHEPGKSTAAAAGGDLRAAGEQTSSFAIADRWGNVVSVTHSVNGGFGSGMVVDGAGFVLNNRGSYFGLDEADINVIAPGKRTRQGAIPAMALKDGKPFLAWNTPGGDTIPQTMTQAFLNVVEFGMNVQQASEAPCAMTSNFRASMYPQSPGNGVAMPQLLADRVGGKLSALGHSIQASATQPPYGSPSGPGAVKMILIHPVTGVFYGGASPGKDNYVAGW
ncbi:MAG: gamma-glutamyltransferase [Bryobacterales bacterium]|nr:gamma-glutamyltransferase [Bryobacterales bacterium]